MYYIYELSDPVTNEIFYVGKGVKKRAESHTRYLKESDTSTKANKIRKILANGDVPKINKVFYSDCKDAINNKEIELIQLYGRRCNNTGILTNITAGGEGGDTVTGVDKEKIQNRYNKRAATLLAKTDSEKAATKKKQSDGIIEAWSKNKEQWSNCIKEGINANRNKDEHARAVSIGWQNRNAEDKKLLSAKRIAIQKQLRNDPTLAENYLKGSKSISIPVKIINSSGVEFISESLLVWCTNNNESYSVLWKIMHKKGPVANKYKTSKYLGWQVINLKEK